MRLLDLLPAFVEELELLCTRAGRPELALQVGGLPIVARCLCGEDNCAMFYAIPPPSGPWDEGHESLALPVSNGRVVLDIVQGKIVAVEVLDREDVSQMFDRWVSPALKDVGVTVTSE